MLLPCQDPVDYDFKEGREAQGGHFTERRHLPVHLTAVWVSVK